MHSVPYNPFQNSRMQSSAITNGILTPIYVPLRYSDNCDCPTGCWYLPNASNPTVSISPFATICIFPPIVKPNDTDVDTNTDTNDDTNIDTNVDTNDDTNFIDLDTSDPILPSITYNDELTSGEEAAAIIGSVAVLFLVIFVIALRLLGGDSSDGFRGGKESQGAVDEEKDPSYKEGRAALAGPDTTAATTREFPKTEMNLEGEVDMGLESEKGPSKKRNIGALEVSSNSMRDYRTAVGPAAEGK